jgi:predicted nucleic acid-binding protein
MNESKNPKYLLDSSVYIAYLNRNDPFHNRTSAFIQKITTRDIVFILPVIIYLEVGNILQKNNPEFKPDDLRLFFKSHEIVDLSLQLAQDLLPQFKKYKLKTSDAIILSIAQLTNSTLITWDKKLQKEANQYISTTNIPKT